MTAYAISVGAASAAKRPDLQTDSSQADRLADLAVEALIDEADLSPKPGLVDRRSSGAHADMTLAMMHASALALWPCLRQMAEAAQAHGEIGPPLRAELGRIGRAGEQAMLATTGGINTHRGAIWALGLLVAAQALDVKAAPQAVAARAGRIALIDDPAAIAQDSHGIQVRQRYGAGGPANRPNKASPPCSNTACPNCAAAVPPAPAKARPGWMPCWRSWPRSVTPACSGAPARTVCTPCKRGPRSARCRRLRQPRWPPSAAPAGRATAATQCFTGWRRRSVGRLPVPRQRREPVKWKP